MRLWGKRHDKRRLAVSILATLMVGILTACSQQPGGSAADAQAGTGGIGCLPGQGKGAFQAQALVKDADGLPVCRDIQGPPVVSQADMNAANGGHNGAENGGSPAQQDGSQPGAATGAGGDADAGQGGTSGPGGASGAGSDAGAGQGGASKPDGAGAGTAGDAAAGQSGSKPGSEPSKPQTPAPPVKLDQPTEPAVVYGGPSGAKLVALTFDDGPDNRYTPKILDILKAKHVHATFFTVGLQVKQYGAVMKRIVKEGCEIGNHSYTHADLSKLDSNHIMNQIKWTDTLIRKQAGYVPRLVRAPYGASSPLLKKIVADNKRSLVFWTVDTRDWEGASVTAMRANVNKNTHPGGIILMHSFGSKHVANTVQLLPLIIKDLQAKGYTFVTVGELLDAKAKNKAAAGSKGTAGAGAKGKSVAGSESKASANAQGGSAAGSESKAAVNAQDESAAGSEGKAGATAKGERAAGTESKASANAQGWSAAGSESKAAVNAQGESVAGSESKAGANAQGESAPGSESKAGANAQGESAAGSESKAGANAKSESAAGSEGKAGANANGERAAGSESKAGTNANGKTAAGSKSSAALNEKK